MGDGPAQRLQGRAAAEAGIRRDQASGFQAGVATSGSLRWQDVELKAATLRVRRTKSTAKSGPKFTRPKNGKGRLINLTRQAVEALEAQKAAQNAEPLKAGNLWQDHQLVFCTHGGRPLGSYNIARTSFKPLLERAELPGMYGFTISGTPARRCCSLAATILGSCRSFWDTPLWL